MPRGNRVEQSRVHLSCQAQYLLKLECDFSWQAQHFVTFWEIAGARNVAFCIEKYNMSPSNHSKFHEILCLPRKVHDGSTSPNTVPATQSDTCHGK